MQMPMPTPSGADTEADTTQPRRLLALTPMPMPTPPGVDTDTTADIKVDAQNLFEGIPNFFEIDFFSHT